MTPKTQDRFAGYSTYDLSPAAALELFEDARGSCPLPHSDRVGGFHALLGYEQVRSGMADWETYSSSPSAVRPVSDRPKSPPLDYDPPEHTAWRRLFAEAFNARIAARVEDCVERE